MFLASEKDNRKSTCPVTGRFVENLCVLFVRQAWGAAPDVCKASGFSRSDRGPYLLRRSPLEEERVPWLLERERDDPPEDLALLGAGLELRDLDGALRVEGAGLLRLLELDAELARVELVELLLRESLLPL